jgi:regulator of replication initiation timing
MTSDPIDVMVREMFALENLELGDRVVALEAENESLRVDVGTLRAIVRAALAQLHTLQTQNDRLRVCLRRDMWQKYGPDAKEKRRAA